MSRSQFAQTRPAAPEHPARSDDGFLRACSYGKARDRVNMRRTSRWLRSESPAQPPGWFKFVVRTEELTEFFPFLRQLINGGDSCKVGKAIREMDRIHLVGERFLQACFAARRSKNSQPVSLPIRRPEKRQALDVIPVGVRNHERGVEAALLKFGVQARAEGAEAAAAVENQYLVAGAHLNACGVTAVARRLRVRPEK